MNEILVTKSSADYELLDSGEGEKLERYSKFVIARPDPQALWKKSLSATEWQKADARFDKNWKKNPKVPESWPIEFGGLKFLIKLTPFKHTGLFPEQLSNWEWIKDQKTAHVLNLFGYTGGASLAAAKSGSELTHLDGSKSAISWARENAKLSGLEEAPIRWILDDARKFLKREIKRGKFYDGIIMDPPAFGHGPNKELWKIEDHFTELMDFSFQVLSKKPAFFLINGYASGYSAIAYENNLKYLVEKFGGKIEKGELTIEESHGKRLLPCGIFARWSS